MNIRSLLKDSKGITLVEVMAAVVILGLLVLAFTSLSNYNLLADKKDTRSSDALLVAQNQMTSVRQYVSINNAFPTGLNYTVDDFTVIIQPSTNLTSGISSYDTSQFLAHHITLQSICYLTAPVLITVTVTWSD